jgi:hypothetical protein
MKKISSKIIVFLFFFTLLWSGVGTFGIHAANAWTLAGVALGLFGFPIQLIFVPVLGLLVRIAGLLLDMSVQFTLNTSMLGGGVDTAIATTWAIIRNIFNITFIFVLLYTAIKTIIGSAGINTKKTIANVIIAALLINFSLFITRVIFDAGNMLATVLYNQIIPANSAATFGIGSVLMDKIGMSEIFQWKQLGESTGGRWTVPFFVASCLQVITLVVLLISFIYAMLLMVTRTVVIIFLMVLSPVGFMGDVLPKISEYSKMWRENLYGQVMVAPIFLLFIYLITLIGKGITDNLATVKTATAASGGDNPEQYMIFFKFTLIIVLVFVAVKVTKKLSGVVGQAVEGFAKMAAGAAIGAATGGASLLGTKIIGAGAKKMMDGDIGKSLKDNGGFAARLALKTLDKTSKASFDARNTTTFKKATDMIGEHTGLKIDYNRGLKIKKDGFQGAVERNTKSNEDYAKLVTKDMPEITNDQIREERTTGIDSRIAERRAKIATLNAKTTLTDQDVIDNEKHHKEIEDLEKRKSFDNVKLKKEMEKEAKNARLEVHAKAAEKSVVNWITGGMGAKKAAAKAIRKLGAEKTAAEIRKEAEKRQAEEDAAAGITPATPPTQAPAPAPTTPPPAKP